MRNTCIIYFFLPFIVLLSSCDKFLEEKSDIGIAIPQKLEELDDLMNYYTRFADDPNAGEIATDDFYLLDNDLNGLNSEDAKNIYRWSDEVFVEDNSNDWRTVY